MKKLFLIVVVLTLMACNNKEQQPETKTITHEAVAKKKLNPNATYQTVSFEIEGMKCAMGCAKVIEKNIAKMDGVKEATVNFDTKTATVSYDIDIVSKNDLTATVTNTSSDYQITTWNNPTGTEKAN